MDIYKHIHISINTYINICVCVYIYIYMYINIYVYMYFIYACIYICAYVGTCMYVYMLPCLQSCWRPYKYFSREHIHAYQNLDLNICIRTRVHKSIHMYICYHMCRTAGTHVAKQKIDHLNLLTEKEFLPSIKWNAYIILKKYIYINVDMCENTYLKKDACTYM